MRTATATRSERWSPRGRMTVRGLAWLATAVLTVGLALYLATTVALSRSTDAEARDAADRVAELVAAGRLPQVLPAAPGQVVQVLDAEGRVLAASLAADRLTAVVTQAEQERIAAGEVVLVPGHRAALSARLRVVGVPVATGSGDRLVVLATPTTGLDATGAALRRWLAVLLPISVVLLAVLLWRLAGTALRPVAQARRSQREFVADAAHELRSPLASIRTQLEVARHLGEGGSLPDDLLPEVDRLSRLVEDLLTLARSDAGQDAQPEPVDLAGMLSDLVARRLTPRVPITVDCAPGITASAVPQDLRRALDNLLDNALRHARTGVELRAVPATNWVEISVTDDGAGIPMAERERVFERFTRLDEARDRDRGGTGLGLPIARELVLRNGGEVHLVDPAQGPGVAVVVRLPEAPTAG